MGIAKSIEAYGCIDYYSEFPEKFLHILSEKLCANFIVNTYNIEYELVHERDKFVNYNKENTYRIEVELQESNNKNIILPFYTLTIPINYVYENELEFSFHCNNLCTIIFLTFEHSWAGLIAGLKYEKGFENARNRYKILRDEYKTICKNLMLNEIFITTHAYYNFESLDNEDKYPALVFSDIVKVAQELDKIEYFNFEEILLTPNSEKLDYFKKKAIELNIAFIDKLE